MISLSHPDLEFKIIQSATLTSTNTHSATNGHRLLHFSPMSPIFRAGTGLVYPTGIRGSYTLSNLAKEESKIIIGIRPNWIYRWRDRCQEGDSIWLQRVLLTNVKASRTTISRAFRFTKRIHSMHIRLAILANDGVHIL